MACAFAFGLHAQIPHYSEELLHEFTGGFPRYLTEFDGKIFFQGFDSTNGYELWATDGTPSGTQMLLDIDPGFNSSSYSPNPAGAYVYNGFRFVNDGTNIFFVARDRNTPWYEIFASDGTSAGTRAITSFPNASPNSGPRDLIVANGTLYFTAAATGSDTELWYARADGSFGLVCDIDPGPNDSTPNYLVHSGNKLYFGASVSGTGREMWALDLTTQTCGLVKDINPGSAQGFVSWSVAAEDNQDGLYFAAADTGNGFWNTELWYTDGTNAGTRLVKEINPDPAARSNPQEMVMFRGILYFTADDGTNGTELWRSDGTESGTYMVKDIVAGAGSSSPKEIRVLGDNIFFRCYDPTYGRELWMSDGTEAGTQIVSDIRAGSAGSEPERLFVADGNLYFIATTDGANSKPYRATPEGRVDLLLDDSEAAGWDRFSFGFFEYLDGYLYFLTLADTGEYALFRIAIRPRPIELSPFKNSTGGSTTTDFVALWDQEIEPTSVAANSFVVHAGFSGARSGQRVVSQDNTTFTPNSAYMAGEEIEVTLTTDITNTYAITDSRGRVIRFRIGANGGPAEFNSERLQSLGSAGSHSAIASADFDGDGDLDLAIASDGGQNLVYLNDGSGVFSSANAIPFGTGVDASSCLAVGDIDNDGDPDIAIGNRFEVNVVYINDGNASFSAGGTFGPRTDDTRALALGDLNADGHLDLVVANFGQQNLIHFNDGAGDFSQSAVGFGPGFDDSTAVAIGDIDADDALDIAVGNLLNPSCVYYNRGDGDFSNQNNEAQIGAGAYYTRGIALGDLDDDQDLEVVLANDARRNLVLYSVGRAFPNEDVEFSHADHSESVVLGDFNGDDALDIAFGNTSEQNFVWLNDGSGGFGSSRTFGSGFDATLGLAAADFDGDGDIDLALANRGNASAVAPNQDGIGMPQSPRITSSAPTSVVSGELYSYRIEGSGVPAPTLSVSGNPSWLTLAGDLLSGTPSDSDIGESGAITLTLANGVGSDASQVFSITVTPLPEAPAITSFADAFASVGQSYSYSIVATGSPTPTIMAMNLPAWLTLSGNLISGTPSLADAGPDGTLVTPLITISAANSAGVVDQQFSIHVIDASGLLVPQIQSQANPVARVGQQYHYQIIAIGSPAPTIRVSNLPDWLSFDANTATISGVPSALDSGVSGLIEVVASIAPGNEAQQSFRIVVLDGSNAHPHHRSYCALSSQGGSGNLLWLIGLALACAVLLTRSRSRELR